MIERKSVLDQVEISRSGVVNVRLALLLVEDGKEIDCKYHRTTIEAGIDPVLQMDFVNKHLEQMGNAQLSAQCLTDVYDYCAINTAKVAARNKV